MIIKADKKRGTRAILPMTQKKIFSAFDPVSRCWGSNKPANERRALLRNLILNLVFVFFPPTIPKRISVIISCDLHVLALQYLCEIIVSYLHVVYVTVRSSPLWNLTSSKENLSYVWQCSFSVLGILFKFSTAWVIFICSTGSRIFLLYFASRRCLCNCRRIKSSVSSQPSTDPRWTFAAWKGNPIEERKSFTGFSPFVLQTTFALDRNIYATEIFFGVETTTTTC